MSHQITLVFPVPPAYNSCEFVQQVIQIISFMNHSLRSLLYLTLIGWLAGTITARAVPPGITVSVTPNVISNNYPGFITLTIGGLTNLAQIKVQTYWDLNSNGVVDIGEPLVDVVGLKESGVTLVGGITNVSIPFDANASTSAITASLSFAPPLNNVTGQKIFRVSSNPTGGFTPVNATLTVTNAALAQWVSGTVYSNGVAPLPYAVVVALTATNQNYVAGAQADAAGHYVLALAPGSYLLLPALPGFYTDQSLLPQIDLTAGHPVTNDLVVTNGLVSVSGRVYDYGNSNLLGGIFLQAQSGNLFGIGFSDTNGNFSVGATSNNWKLKITSERLGWRGYLAPQGTALTVNTVAGNVTNADLPLYRGNAMIYGQVTLSNQPVPNVVLEADDSNQLLTGKVFTDAGGYYALPIFVNAGFFGGTTTWHGSISSGSLPDNLQNFIFNQQDMANLGTNQALNLNLAGLPVTTTLAGRLVNPAGTPIGNISVGASAMVNGLSYSAGYIDTDTNGYFTFGVAAGSWMPAANCCGSDGYEAIGYYAPAYATVTVPPAATNLVLLLYPASQPALGAAQKVGNSLFDFNLYGAAGYNYAVQYSTNLAGTNWITSTVISNYPGGAYLLQDNQAINPSRFYRVLPAP